MSTALLVADSGPLIALARLDLLGLPSRYFESVLVTASVWEEIERKPGGNEAARLSAAVDKNLLRVIPDPKTVPTSLFRAGIDDGERSALALAIELGATMLADDRRARRAALESGRPVIGTLGLLVLAREDGSLAAIRPLVERLQATGYFMSSGLVTRVLASLGE